MELKPTVWFDEVVKTYHIIAPHIHHTQVVTCPDLNEELGGKFLFKPESLQITGSFKVRGALSAISRLSKDELKRGVIAYSSGNHAQGVAHAAKVFNTPATVVMPKDAPARKIANAKALGAQVIHYDRRTESREEISREIAKEKNLVIINPYDALETIYGQGTAAYEVINDANNPKLDNAIICAGGGGLTAGSCISIKHINSECNVFTAEPEEWNDHQLSFEKNERIFDFGVDSNKINKKIFQNLFETKKQKILFFVFEESFQKILWKKFIFYVKKKNFITFLRFKMFLKIYFFLIMVPLSSLCCLRC